MMNRAGRAVLMAVDWLATARADLARRVQQERAR